MPPRKVFKIRNVKTDLHWPKIWEITLKGTKEASTLK